MIEQLKPLANYMQVNVFFPPNPHCLKYGQVQPKNNCLQGKKVIN